MLHLCCRFPTCIPLLKNPFHQTSPFLVFLLSVCSPSKIRFYFYSQSFLYSGSMLCIILTSFSSSFPSSLQPFLQSFLLLRTTLSVLKGASQRLQKMLAHIPFQCSIRAPTLVLLIKPIKMFNVHLCHISFGC